ncbi:MAG: class I SAM-dependent methyltransferase [Actinobacteria bacterium]|nr:class I SAM-dependent methyltransferase [Actinomycetota bacterium]
MYNEGYYRYRESTRDFLIEARSLYSMLAPRPDSRVLEVGCGGGALLSFLEARGHNAVGVDILEEAVRLASQAAPSSRVIQCDAGELPFDSGSFDRLLSHHLVEHLDDLPGALEEWHRVLAPGSVMAICTPNRLYPSPRIFDDPSHVHVYDRRELAAVVEEAGFRVEDSLTVFPHLWRDRISVAVGVPLYRAFTRLPGFRDRGRSLLLSARRR